MDVSDISVEAEVELGGVEDLDRFLKEREDALDQVSSGIKEDDALDADGDISPKSISSDDINKRLAQLQNLIDDGAGNNADGKSDAMTLGEIKGSKLDFGSPEKVAGVALSSATLKSPLADDELESRLQRLSKMLDDNTATKMPIGIADVEYISGEELGKGLLDESSGPPEWHSLNVLLRQNGFGGFHVDK